MHTEVIFPYEVAVFFLSFFSKHENMKKPKRERERKREYDALNYIFVCKILFYYCYASIYVLFLARSLSLSIHVMFEKYMNLHLLFFPMPHFLCFSIHTHTNTFKGSVLHILFILILSFSLGYEIQFFSPSFKYMKLLYYQQKRNRNNNNKT